MLFMLQIFLEMGQSDVLSGVGYSSCVLCVSRVDCYPVIGVCTLAVVPCDLLIHDMTCDTAGLLSRSYN